MNLVDGTLIATVRHQHSQVNRSDEIVEKGDIFFTYRPSVEESEPEGVGDVQGSS
jgi:hypothetical protein